MTGVVPWSSRTWMREPVVLTSRWRVAPGSRGVAGAGESALQGRLGGAPAGAEPGELRALQPDRTSGREEPDALADRGGVEVHVVREGNPAAIAEALQLAAVHEQPHADVTAGG